MEKTFAEKLKEARKAAGLTQKTMVELMLMPRRTLEDWERGINEPPEYIKRLVLNELERIKKQ
jgi:transcriptional regulator with XRE-family HTH domain